MITSACFAIWHCDETGRAFNALQNRHVVGRRDEKFFRSHPENFPHISMLGMANAAGECFDPLLVFQVRLLVGLSYQMMTILLLSLCRQMNPAG